MHSVSSFFKRVARWLYSHIAKKPEHQKLTEEETSDVLQNAAWFKLVQECITLFDKLDRTGARMDPQRQELAGYVCSQLEEILERSGVRIISGDVSFDEHFHLPEPARERVAPGTAIAETLSSGFAVGPRVLRRAHVRLKEQSSDGKRALESREHIEKEQH